MRLSEFRLLSGGEWRSAAARNHTARARRSGRLRQEMFGAPEKTKPTSYEENSHRFPAEANRASRPVGVALRPRICGDTPMGA
jgi:hypothetical protein